MSTEADLLSALAATPEDEATFLVYADWLEDSADEANAALGQFIRLQCERAGLASGDPRRLELGDREDQLIARWHDDWFPDAPAARDHLTFHRGFVAHLSSWVFPGETPPLQYVVPTVSFGTLGRLGALLPVWAPRHLQEASWDLKDLPRPWSRLANFDTDHSDFCLVEDGIGEFLGSPELLNLTALHIGNSDLEDPALVVLAGNPALCNLAVLDFSSGSLELWGSNNLTAAGIYALTRSPHLQFLHCLRLDVTGTGPDTAHILARSPYFPRLRHLSLEGVGINDEGVRALVESPLLARLTRLSLAENDLTDSAIEALVSSPAASGLRQLNLLGGRHFTMQLTDESARLLAESPHLEQLSTLAIGDTGLLTPAGATLLRDRFGESVTIVD